MKFQSTHVIFILKDNVIKGLQRHLSEVALEIHDTTGK